MHQLPLPHHCVFEAILLLLRRVLRAHARAAPPAAPAAPAAPPAAAAAAAPASAAAANLPVAVGEGVSVSRPRGRALLRFEVVPQWTGENFR